MEKVERILLSVHQFGKAGRESARRIAAGPWLEFKEFIKDHIHKKVSLNFTPFFSL